MKINYILPSALASLVMIATSCSDNAWNDHYIDGFQSNDTYSAPVTVTYDLTPEDYQTIGNGLYNKENEADQNAAANNIKNNYYFDQQSCYPMEYAVAWFLNRNNTNFQVYDVGSKVQVGVRLAQGQPEELTSLQAAKRMVLSEAPTTSNIPSMLSQNFPDATQGQYAIVSYPGAAASTKAVQPAKTKAATRADDGLTSNIKNLKAGDKLTATAVVTGQSVRGLILTDNAGSILYYNTAVDLSNYPIGTIVNVSGTLTAYNRALELDDTATITKTGSMTYNYPTAVNYTGKMIDEACEGTGDFLAQFVRVSGTMNINNNYYNLVVDGATCQASVYYATDNIKNRLINGAETTLYGYFVAVNGTNTKYFNILVIGVAENGNTGNGGNGGGDNTGGDNTGGDNTGGDNNGNGGSDVGADAWTVAEALSQINSGYDKEATVKGYVIKVTEISTSYGNGTYIIADNKTDEAGLTIFRGYYLDGEKFTSEDQLKVGDLVVVQGTCTLYNGTTPEMTGSKILSINGVGNGGSGGSTGTSIDENTAVNLVYVFNGSAWTAAENAVTVNPSAYAQMGFSVNNLNNPSLYLPIYMKQAYPYVTAQTEMLVAYNLTSSGCGASLLIYNGSDWTVNDNYLEDRVAEFNKTSDGYQFRKFIGEETYFPFEQDEIKLNCGYLFVSGTYCAGPVAPTSGYYGYMYPQDIEFNEEDGSVTLPTSDFTYTFLSEIEINGNMYSTPEGKFLIQGADGNLVYLSGPTYYNFGIQSDPYYSTYNGEFKDSYLWSAKKQSDGKWMIYCDYEYNNEMYHKVIYYADSYRNFANYTDAQLASHSDAVLIELYISEDFLDNTGNGDSSESE